MTPIELVRKFEEAIKLESAGKLAEALAIYTQISVDKNCPKQLLITVEKTLNQLQFKKLKENPPVSKIADSKEDKIYDVDVFVIELIPQIANAMPIKQEDYDRLKEGIKQRNIVTPLIVLPNLKLVCGYNRLKIAKELEFKTVPVIFKNIPDDKIFEYAMKDNIERRQLSTDHIADYVMDNATQSTGRPKKHSRQKTNADMAKVLGVSKRTVQRAKKFAQKVQENPQLKGRSIREVIEDNQLVQRLTNKGEYTVGAGDFTEQISNDMVSLMNKILESNPDNGDTIKIITQIYFKKRGN